jgi:hypothetical protein
MADDIDALTAEELLAELRGRERAARTSPATVEFTPGPRAKGAAAPAGATTAAPGVVPRFRNLNDLSSAEIAKLMNARQRAIYGVDDRQDTKDITNARQKALAEASVALVETGDLQAAGAGFALRTKSYKTEYNLCANERYASQPLGCFCSGVLVAADVVATAGHCIKSQADLAKVRFVFGFRMIDDAKARTEFGADDVYTGAAILGRQLTSGGTDWALVRLDRAVVGRQPVPLRRTGKIADDEPVFVIGHPCGLPQKVAGGARVRNNNPSTHFVANLDTYGGNSGSPVFSSRTFELEGLLVRGQTDFVSTGNCNVSMVFPTSGAGGEDVTRTTEWANKVAGAGKAKPKTRGKVKAKASGKAKARGRKR